MPKYISECWKKARPGDEVGKVVISKLKYVFSTTYYIVYFVTYYSIA